MLNKTADLSDARRTLLDKYLRADLAPRTLPQPRRERKALTPASLSQEQLWLEAQERRIQQIYTESITIFRNGPVDINALAKSLNEIIRRHQLWRSSFEMSGGQLYQRVNEITDFPLALVDLSKCPAPEREREASRIANAQAHQPFDLHSAPLVRASLVSFDDHEHRLYIDMHQIVTDGISAFHLFPVELVTLYDSFLVSKPSPLPELSAQFADYALWQREYLQGSTQQAQLEHWREHFTVKSEPLRWPRADVQLPFESHRAKIERFVLAWENLEEFQTVRKKEGVSLFASLVAVFTTLLYSYARQSDIPLGTFAPCGRHQTEFQNLLGYFMNPVLLQLRVNGSETVPELMGQAQEVISGAISNGDVPYQDIIKMVGSEPVPGRNPVLQVGVSLAPPVAPLPPGWDMTSMNAESGYGRWGLYMVMSERTEHLMGRIQYNPDTFTQTTIAALLDDYRKVLKAAGEHPDYSVSHLLQAADLDSPVKLQ